jgi:exopolyphosphatase/guanosine-5'-triphosphate,3'-diphosphate pyrophosphatase
VRRIGIADLGSNTARLVVFDYEAGAWFQMMDSVREPVRLGEGLAHDGQLVPAAIERALAAVELFEDYGVAVELDEIEILATSAVREAANRDEVLEPIRRGGYSVHVLSGEEEAELGVLAVANSFRDRDGWVMDLGGGSAQVSAMRDRCYAGGRAYPLGAVRLTEQWLAGDPPTDGEVAALEEAVAGELGAVAAEIRSSGAPLFAVGGTIRNLAKIDRNSRAYPLSILHGYRLRRDGLEAVLGQLRSTTLEERQRMPGLRPDRADIIIAGALVFRWLMRAAGLDEITISGQGVREGAFYRHLLPPPHHVADVRAFSVQNLARRHPQPPRHVRQVKRLADHLFTALAPIHQLGEAERDLLASAALLHDVGTSLDYYRHESHGEYILTSAALPGFDPRELALLSLMVRYHRKGTPRVRLYEGILGPQDERLLGQLTACLRTAESLERSRAGRVREVEVEIDEQTIRLTLVAREEPAVELWEVRQHAELFRQAFGGRRLEVGARVEPTGAETEGQS